MNFIKKNLIGILVCFFIAIPSWLIGKIFPVIGGPVIDSCWNGNHMFLDK